MTRDGQISREEGFKKLEKERTVPQDVIEGIVRKAGVDSKYFFERLDKQYGKI